MRVVLTSGFSKSLHAIALIHGLAARGHHVVACLEVSVWNPQRLRFYVRQIGWRPLWNKVTSRLLAGRSRSPLQSEVAPMIQYLREHGISSQTVRRACARVGARCVKVKTLNDSKAIAALNAANADLVVYAGGGILRQEFLSAAGIGVLNAHGGPLPHFRGMNAAEWALFHGVRPAVALHYIDTGIDTGPVSFQVPISHDTLQSIDQVRGVMTRIGVETLIEAVDRVRQGSLEPIEQDPDGGRQFFVMAEPLLEVVRQWLDQKQTPGVEPDVFRFPGRAAIARNRATQQ